MQEDDQNPYAPPKAALADSAEEVGVGEPAGFGRRFVAYLIDYTVISTAVQVPYLLLWWRWFGWPGGSQEEMIQRMVDDPEGFRELVFAISLAISLIYLVIHLGYYGAMETWSGRTLGKMLARTRVVTTQGGRPGWRRVLLRSLIRIVPFEQLSIFFRRDRSMWHDRWSRTRVVEEPDVS